LLVVIAFHLMSLKPLLYHIDCWYFLDHIRPSEEVVIVLVCCLQLCCSHR
jgi:hypothetical protein